MAKPLSDKKPDHSHRPGGGPNYPLPSYSGYMGDPYGAYGGGGPAYNQVSKAKSETTILSKTLRLVLLYSHHFFLLQPMIYGRGPAPTSMRMVPMVLPDGRLGYVL